MYQASTVLTGSEMPALNSIGPCAAADSHPMKARAKTAAKMRVAREEGFVCMFVSSPPSLFVTVAVRHPIPAAQAVAANRSWRGDNEFAFCHTDVVAR